MSDTDSGCDLNIQHLRDLTIPFEGELFGKPFKGTAYVVTPTLSEEKAKRRAELLSLVAEAENDESLGKINDELWALLDEELIKGFKSWDFHNHVEGDLPCTVEGLQKMRAQLTDTIGNKPAWMWIRDAAVMARQVAIDGGIRFPKLAAAKN